MTLEAKLFEANTLTGAFHYRSDEHNEQQDGFIRTPPAGNPFVNAPYSEPWQNTKEDIFSVALEDVQKFSDVVRLVTGLSYDWTNLSEASDVNVSATGTTIANSTIVFTPVNYPKKDMNGVNTQAALIWDNADTLRTHASISSRVRFPTLFERFSSRFGTAIPNPDIEPERATNYEIGARWDFMPKATLEGAVFYSDIQDALVQVPVVQPAPFGTVNQTRNAASAEYTGLELSLTAELSDAFNFGGNLTWMDRSFDQVPPTTLTGVNPPTTGADPTNPNFQPQGVPDFKAFLYANLGMTPWLTITPSIEAASDRWTVTSSSAVVPPRFYETGQYVLFNLAIDWELSDNASLLLSARNITDQNYLLVDGFPEEGRNFTASLRIRN